MSRIRTYKFRADPTPAQAQELTEQLGFACDLYNAVLQERVDTYRVAEQESGRRRPWHYLDGDQRPKAIRLWDTDARKYQAVPAPKGLTRYDQSKRLTEYRQAHPDSFPVGMSALVMVEVLQRVDRAFAAFFKRAKEGGGRAGFPRFRSSRRYDSLTFGLTHRNHKVDPETGEVRETMTSGAGTYRDGVLRLTGVGELRLEQHRDMPEDAIAKTAIVRRSCGRWYVTISAELPAACPAPDDRPPVGLDVGVIQWCTAFTPDPAAAERLAADLQRMAIDPLDQRRLWAAERHAQRLSAALTHYAKLGVPPPYGCGARRARLARMARRRHARVLFRLRQIEARIAKLRKRLAAAAAVATVVPDEAGAAVLIEGSHAGPRHARRVARTQRSLARRTKRGHSHSHRRKKAVGPYARAKERERCARADHRHKASRALVRQFGLICVEDLDVRKLTAAPGNEHAPESELPADIKRRLNNRILDQAWDQFFQVTAYKAEDAGTAFAKKSAVHTTQECAGCGKLVPKPMTLRVHRCPACGYVAPRPVNSARNVLQRPLEQPGRAGPSGDNGGGLPRAVA